MSNTMEQLVAAGEQLAARVRHLETIETKSTSRWATIGVAAYDAPESWRRSADYLCDGTADEVQVQAAVDALSSAGGRVVLSEGTFNFADSVTETSDNVNIQGAGIEATKIVPANTVIAISFEDAFFGSVSDLSIAAKSQQTGGAGIRWLSDCYQMAIRRVRFENLYDDIRVNCYTSSGGPRSETGIISDCIMVETKHHRLDLLRFSGLFISNCNAWGTSDSTRGIYWVQGGGLWIYDCDLIRCGNAIVINAGSGQTAKWMFASNVSLDTLSGAGILITGAGSMEHYQFSNLHISGAGSHGVYIASAALARHIHFINTRVLGSQYSGYYLNGIRDVSIIGGEVLDNNRADSAAVSAQQGIHLTNVDNLRIIGVRAKDGEYASPASYQKYGIYHASGGSDIIIQGNDLTDNETGGLYSGNLPLLTVRDNLGFVTEADGTDSISSGNTTKAVTHGLSTTPTVINVVFAEQATNDYGRWWVDTVGTTTFTVNVSADPGASNLDFWWEAKVR